MTPLAAGVDGGRRRGHGALGRAVAASVVVVDLEAAKAAACTAIDARAEALCNLVITITLLKLIERQAGIKLR